MRNLVLAAIAVVSTTFAVVLPAQAAEALRIGVLKFGTVNWELKALKTHKFDEKNGVNVEIVPFAGEDASAVALRSGAVDMIVTDWLEVSRSRALGDDLAFVPYSSSVGGLMVPGGSDLQNLSHLKGKKIGIAGGPLDKTWLLIRGYATKEYGIDLVTENELVFGAPPLLAEKAKQGEVDAVLNFWHYCARLEADGFRRLISAEDAASGLGIEGAVSALGYVFHEGWAKEHQDAVVGFIKASRETKALLKESDGEWQSLHAEGVIKDEGAALISLRDRYREGIPARNVVDEEADAARLYAILAKLGGEKLVGKGAELAPGTYWSGLRNAF